MHVCSRLRQKIVVALDDAGAESRREGHRGSDEPHGPQMVTSNGTLQLIPKKYLLVSTLNSIKLRQNNAVFKKSELSQGLGA